MSSYTKEITVRLLLCVLIISITLSCTKDAGYSLEKRLTKRVNKIEGLSRENRDSLTAQITSMGILINEASQMELDMYKTLIESDREHGVPEDTLRARVQKLYPEYKEKIRQIVEIRYNMRSFLTEEQWSEFSLRSPIEED